MGMFFCLWEFLDKQWKSVFSYTTTSLQKVDLNAVLQGLQTVKYDDVCTAFHFHTQKSCTTLPYI